MDAWRNDRIAKPYSGLTMTYSVLAMTYSVLVKMMYRGWLNPPSFPPLWGAEAGDTPMSGVDQVLSRERERM